MNTRETRSTCPYCGVGCGVIIESDDHAITGVRGDPEHPANFGRLCTKGSTLHLTAAVHLTNQVRLLQPMRRESRGADPQPVAWSTAIDELAGRIAATVEAHGPDAVGLYLSGQMLTEDYYVFNKLGKGLIGTNNVDTNSRLCMSSAVAGYKATLGADAPPACYEDLDHARTVFIAGSNTAWAHPVLFRRLEDARRAKPDQRWIVVDPRRTETAAMADLHLPLLPGTDVALFHGLLHLMLWEGLTDATYIAAHTTGFDALRDRVREFTPKHVAKVCGLQEADIVQAARWFAGLDNDGSSSNNSSTRSPTLSLYCQGLNQSASGSDKNAALINLHLATAQIGQPGAGPFSLTGQGNAMGGREVGGLAHLLGGHREVANPAHRAEIAALWGMNELPSRPGRSALEMFEAAADGEIKLLWIVCTNPAQSLPDQALVRRALQRCEFVVLQEAYRHTATAPFADLLLPAASWGEKEGSVTNSERRIGRVRGAVPPPGQARNDWQIGIDVARALEQRLPARRIDGQSLFPYGDAQQIWEEHRESTRGRDLDITGIDWRALDHPVQWPCADGATTGKTRLYEDGRFPTADGRARFAAPAWRPVAEPRDARFPFSLTTGRLRDQWHGGSRTGTLGRLFAHGGEPAIELHPQELDRRHWKAGDLLRVRSRRGAIVLPVQPNDAMAPAQAFVAMHWGEEFVGGLGDDGRGMSGVNALTSPARCPQSKQPELKHAAIRLEKFDAPWRLVAAAWLAPDQWLRVRESLRAPLSQLAFWSAVPFGREPDGRVGLLLRGGALYVPQDQGEAIDGAFGLGSAGVLRYADARRGLRRTLRLGDDDALDAFIVAGDVGCAEWALSLLQARLPAREHARVLLSGRTAAAAPRSPQVCNCFDVSQAEIVNMLAASGGSDAERIASVQQKLHCGTQCGSCLPAIKALAHTTPAAMREAA
jgi:assimilatory nitrate reductase catalytic subunit